MLLIHCLLLLPLLVGVLCLVFVFLFCYLVLSILSSFAMIMSGKRDMLLYFHCLSGGL